MLFIYVVATTAFSGGGGSGNDGEGKPYLQACDAVTLCATGVCPAGMVMVAPPERSPVYRLDVADGATSYVPERLVTLQLTVTSPRILSKENAGYIVGARNETSKYLGLLLYAVDASEQKVGDWEIPLEEPRRFWTPPDEPGCGGRALMHAGAELKHYLETFYFRAPAAGAGPLTFRALVKQGETNRGAFYWPTTVSGGDLMLSEAAAPPAALTWRRGEEGASCATTCAAEGEQCEESALAAADSAAALREGVAATIACALPLLASDTCDEGPRTSGLGDGWCFYRDACPAPSTPLCDVLPSGGFSDGLLLCPCRAGSRRRRAAAPEEAAATPEQAVGCPNARLA